MVLRYLYRIVIICEQYQPTLNKRRLLSNIDVGAISIANNFANKFAPTTQTKKSRGISPGRSRWNIRVAAPAHPVGNFRSGWLGASPPWLPRSPFLAFATRSLETDHPWSFPCSLIPWLHHSTNRTIPGGIAASLAASFAILRKYKFNDLPWSPPASPLHLRNWLPSPSPALALLF